MYVKRGDFVYGCETYVYLMGRNYKRMIMSIENKYRECVEWTHKIVGVKMSRGESYRWWLCRHEYGVNIYHMKSVHVCEMPWVVRQSNVDVPWNRVLVFIFVNELLRACQYNTRATRRAHHYLAAGVRVSPLSLKSGTFERIVFKSIAHYVSTHQRTRALAMIGQPY